MISVATGLIFQFMIARTFLPGNETQYGLWFNMNDLSTYFTLMMSVLSFWTMRFVTRNKEGAVKTGILVNLSIGLAAASIYALIIPSVTSSLNISHIYLLAYALMAIQILELYSINMLEACLQGKIPHTIGYGLLVQQIGRVAIGYVLLIVFNQLLLGAIVTTIVSFSMQILYYFRLLAPEFKQKIRLQYVREWIKGSIINVYNVVGNQIASYIFIMLFIYGGDAARARFGAATVVANVITYSSFLAYALYPKLLAERKSEDITVSIKMVLMFAIPLTTGALALADSYMTILTEIYTDSAPVLAILAVDSFMLTISGLFTNVLYGVETVDETGTLRLRQLARSRLFAAFSLPYVHALMTLPTAYFVLTNYALSHPLQAALYVGIINFAGHFSMFLVLYAIVRRMIKLEIPWRIIAKYVFASAIMGSILYFVPHPTRISLTLAETALGGGIYLVVLLAVDKETRILARNVIGEIRGSSSRTSFPTIR